MQNKKITLLGVSESLRATSSNTSIVFTAIPANIPDGGSLLISFVRSQLNESSMTSRFIGIIMTHRAMKSSDSEIHEHPIKNKITRIKFCHGKIHLAKQQ